MATVLKLKKLLDLDDAQTAQLTGISVRTYQRRKQHNKPLSSSETDAMLRTARLVEEAITTFGDEGRALRWLKAQSATLNAIPLDLLASDAAHKPCMTSCFAAIEEPASLPSGWNALPYRTEVQAAGDRFVRDGRSLALRILSAIVPAEFNVLVNPVHARMADVVVQPPGGLVWDVRLFD